jgi:hypothetical protein
MNDDRIDKSKIVWDDERPAKIDTSKATWETSRPFKYADKMFDTLKRVGEIIPAFETAASLATASYGVPISGLVGLAALPFGAEASKNAIEATQKFMIYQPQTEGGKQLTEAASYPMSKLSDVGAAASGAVAEKTGNSALGAMVDAGINAAPALIGGGRTAPRVNAGYPKAVEYGINKGVRPPITKKEVLGQRERYMENAQIAVDEIIQNKDNLKLSDRDGNIVSGKMPESLNQFSEAINQTKNKIFEEYDALSKQADTVGAAVNMTPIVAELDGIVSNRVLQTMSPETIAYANSRKTALEGKSFTTQETQQMVQILNQSEKAYYANPTPELKGKAYVDGLIAANLRSGLDAAIETATGIEYQPLKQKYGALRMLETDVTKRAIVDARKNIRGLIDFSDIFTSSQVVQGIMAQQPALVAAGMTAKLASSMIKMVNDPNRIIAKMFDKAEKNSRTNYVEKYPITPGFAVSAIAGEDKETE